MGYYMTQMDTDFKISADKLEVEYAGVDGQVHSDLNPPDYSPEQGGDSTSTRR